MPRIPAFLLLLPSLLAGLASSCSDSQLSDAYVCMAPFWGPAEEEADAILRDHQGLSPEARAALLTAEVVPKVCRAIVEGKRSCLYTLDGCDAEYYFGFFHQYVQDRYLGAEPLVCEGW